MIPLRGRCNFDSELASRDERFWKLPSSVFCHKALSELAEPKTRAISHSTLQSSPAVLSRPASPPQDSFEQSGLTLRRRLPPTPFLTFKSRSNALPVESARKRLAEISRALESLVSELVFTLLVDSHFFFKSVPPSWPHCLTDLQQPVGYLLGTACLLFGDVVSGGPDHGRRLLTRTDLQAVKSDHRVPVDKEQVVATLRRPAVLRWSCAGTQVQTIVRASNHLARCRHRRWSLETGRPGSL